MPPHMLTHDQTALLLAQGFPSTTVLWVDNKTEPASWNDPDTERLLDGWEKCARIAASAQPEKPP